MQRSRDIIDRIEKEIEAYNNILADVEMDNYFASLNGYQSESPSLDKANELFRMRLKDAFQQLDKYYEGDPLSDEYASFATQYELFYKSIGKDSYIDTLAKFQMTLDNLLYQIGIEETSNSTLSLSDDIWVLVHDVIKDKCKQKYIDGHFADAVETAFKEINTIVKDRYKRLSGIELDGSSLMNKVFSSEHPFIIFEDMETQNGINVQKGYQHMFAGAMQGIRNPKAHSNMHISAKDAMQRLIFASLLLDKLDHAVDNRPGTA